MEEDHIRLLQTVLADAGHYHGMVDGIFLDETESAVSAMIATRSAELDSDPAVWSVRRRATACLQLGCKDAGRAVGPIDGLWGPMTDNAVDEFQEMRVTGTDPAPWRDETPADVNPRDWPGQSESALTDFYGPACDEGRLVIVECPWRLSLDWNLEQQTSKIPVP